MQASDIEDARRRLEHSPKLPFEVVTKMRTLAGMARNTRSAIDAHMGPAHVHAEIERDVLRAIDAAGAIGAGPEQLIALEASHASLSAAFDLENEELQRRATGARQARLQAICDANRETTRIVTAAKATATIRDTLTTLRANLDAIELTFGRVNDDGDILEAVIAAEAAIEAAGRALSAERRALRPRVVKLQADRAAAALLAEAA